MATTRVPGRALRRRATPSPITAVPRSADARNRPRATRVAKRETGASTAESTPIRLTPVAPSADERRPEAKARVRTAWTPGREAAQAEAPATTGAGRNISTP